MADDRTRLHRSACVECQRRKQKCNREWPCNHCQKRRVIEQCRFNNPVSPSERTTPALQRKRSRSLDKEDVDIESGGDDDDDLDLESLGYMTGPLLSSLTMEPQKTKKPSEKLQWRKPEDCPQLKRALEVLPPRKYMDQLIQIFMSNVNYHYYIIFPTKFIEEHQQWWERRARGDALTLQWTYLVAMVCACAIQHLDLDTKPSMEAALGKPMEELTVEYHHVGQEVGKAIPVRQCHLLSIQAMLHSIYWYKAEAKFVEAWHLIGAAVRDSQELGLHKKSQLQGLPEFEREMRRRVWCILATWDWQFASGLCRPTVIDHSDVDVESPTLTLEQLDPSPLLHMKLQSEAITSLSARFGAPKNVRTCAEIQEYKTMIESWLKTFPAVYDMDNPDVSKDLEYPWATSHRFYIHTMAYLMVLNPIRLFMSKTFDHNSPPEELKVRADGVYYSLRNLETTMQWTKYASHRDGRYHFIIFSLFDTASVLTAAILKDEDKTIPRRDEILAGIEKAVVLLRQINTLSKTAKTSYDLLSRMARRLPRSNSRNKRVKTETALEAPLPAKSPYVAVEQVHQQQYWQPVQGSNSTSPSNFANSSTAGSSPHNQGYAASTPESAGQSVTGRNISPNTSITNTTHSGTGMPPQYHRVEMGPPVPPATFDNQHMPPTFAQHDFSMPGMLNDPSLMPMPHQYTDLQPAVPEMIPGMAYEPITDQEMGEFNMLWDWNSLNLDFIHSEQMANRQM